MNQPTEPEFLDDVGLKKPDRSILVAKYHKKYNYIDPAIALSVT